MKRHRSSLQPVVTVLIILLLAGGVFLAIRTRHKNPTATQSNTASGTAESKINMEPATDQEKSDSEQRKEEAANNATTPTQPSTQPSNAKKSVSPVIVNASMGESLTVRAYVAGIFEDGGTCTLEASQDNNKVTKQTSGFKDATTTTCTAFSIPRSEFPTAGTWKLVLTYDSTTAHGVSQTISTEIK